MGIFSGFLNCPNGTKSRNAPNKFASMIDNDSQMNNLIVLLKKLADQRKLNIGFIFRISYFTKEVIQFFGRNWGTF